jgi:high-affinity nickel permease
MTTTNDQLTPPPQLTTGSLNQSQNEKETVDKRPQFDVGAIVGGAVSIVFIITAGIVIMFVLYSVLKYRQTAKQLRCGTS